jgi:hypothetical protein
MIAVGLKSFGLIRTAPGISIVCTTWLTVVRRIRVFKTLQLTNEESNQLFVWKSNKLFKVSSVVTF